MNENQIKIQNYQDDIDLKAIILALWKQKIMILSVTLIAAFIVGLYSVFIIPPVYDTKLNIVISMPETYATKYGEYKLPITTNQQYINLITSNDVLLNTINDMGYDTMKMTVEALKKAISVGKIETTTDIIQNSFEVVVSANNNSESLKLAETLYKNYIEFMDVMIKGRAISKFHDDFSISIKSMNVSLKSNQDILEKNMELLAKTPQTINQKEAMNAIQGQLKNTSDYVVLENIINPNYTKVESDIIGNKQTINSIENSINVYNLYIAELDEEKKALEDYYQTGKELDSGLIGIVETSVYLPSPPIAPTRKTSPSNTMNTAIGAVIGGMIGVLIALVRKYWFIEPPISDNTVSAKQSL